MEESGRLKKIKSLIKAENDPEFSFERLDNLLECHPIVYGVVFNPATILDVLNLPKLQKTLGIEESDASLLHEVKDLHLTLDSVMVLRNKLDSTSLQIFNRFSGNLVFSTHNEIKAGYNYYGESKEKLVGDIARNTICIATSEKKSVPVYQRRTRKLLLKEVDLDSDYEGPSNSLKQPLFMENFSSLISAQDEYLYFYDIKLRKASRVEMDDDVIGDAFYFNDLLVVRGGEFIFLLLEKPFSNEMKMVSFSVEKDSDGDFSVEKIAESEIFKILNKKDELRAMCCHEDFLDNLSMFHHGENIIVYKNNTFWVFSVDDDGDNIELIKEHEVQSSLDDQLIFQKGNLLVLLRPSEQQLITKCLSME